MKLKDKIKKAKVNARVAYLVTLFAVVYFAMITLKGLYILTAGSTHDFSNSINNMVSWIMDLTHFPPLGALWINIPFLPFKLDSLFDAFMVVIPPFIVCSICVIVISDHKKLRSNYFVLKAKIEKESRSKGIRKAADIQAAVESTLDNLTENDKVGAYPSWRASQRRIGLSIGFVIMAAALVLK